MRSSFGCLCSQGLNLVSSPELGGGCGSHGLLPWVFWGSAQGNLEYHSEPVSVGSGRELFQITPMETSSGIQPVEPGSKKKKKIKRGRGKKSKGKRYVIDVRKHKIKTDLFSLPHGAHWLL